MRLVTTGVLLACLLAVWGLVSGCSSEDSLVEPETHPETDLEKFEANSALWSRTKPANYGFSFQQFCYCGREYLGSKRVTVRGDSLFSVIDTDSGLDVTSSAPPVFSIDFAFEVVEVSLDFGADSIRVVYDAEYGYPTEIDVDMTFSGVDDELQILVWDFIVD